MPKEIIFFEENKFSFKKNFFNLMNSLLKVQSCSLIEAIIINAINHIQILSAFYSKQIKIFKPDKYKSDYILYIIESIFRIKDLFKNNYFYLEILNYVIFGILVIFILGGLLEIFVKEMNYIKYNINITNIFIKIFLFFLYNVSLDVSWSQICFGKRKYNPNFEEEIECFGKNKYMVIIPILTIIISFFIYQILRIYHNESFFISDILFSKLNSYYDALMDFNNFINSILLIQASFLNQKLFLYYNLIFSIFIFFYYIKNCIYYNIHMNVTTGIFHIIYAWTSIFSLFIFYIDIEEEGLVYIISCIIVGCIYYYLINKMKKKLIYEISINKINNINYLLVYLKTLTDALIKYDNNTEKKALISGVLDQLIKESPNKICNDLIKEKMYIPLNNAWRDEKKENITDIVFIKYFIIIIYNYFLISKNSCPEIFLNLSHYYLLIIGNYCEAMYFCQKLFEFNLNAQQEFSFYRLKVEITQSLAKKFKESNDKNISLENVNISTYYHYESLCDNFLEEIKNDIDLSLKFWKLFEEMHKNVEFKLNFKEVFELAEKIQIKKKNIDKIWNNLMKKYSGINDYFELYNEYIVQINDDDIKNRELDAFKKNLINQDDDLNSNFYSILFNKDTGLVIVSKDIGTEGIIKHYNKTIEKIFKYSDQELKEKSIDILMPKIIANKHSSFMENYFKTGYNKYIEKKDFKTFAKTKNNSIFQIRLAIKLLPVLNHNVIFVGMIVKDNLNDIILIDENYIIQGICEKLKHNLNIENDFLFQYNDIPFYVICKKFINFYKIFLSKNKKKENANENENKHNKEIVKKVTNSTDKDNNKIIPSSKRKGEGDEEPTKKEEKEEDVLINKQEIEINENFELEFEIKFPQFIINYSNKTKKEKKFEENIINMKEETIDKENEDKDIDDEDNELLLSNYSKTKMTTKKKYPQTLGGLTPTPTPYGETPTFTFSASLLNIHHDYTIQEKRYLYRNVEERIFYERMEKMYTLFKDEKFEDLEDLIDSYNKDSTQVEYKFNFTFDNYKFGDNYTSYIVRCIDKNNIDYQSEEKSFELDQNMIKYRANKIESIKPLYEITREEREETIEYPLKFFQLLENENFRAVLDEYKTEINKMSKIQNNNLLNHDNSSHSQSHSSFDNDLMVKNKIGELRSNIFQDKSNFVIIRYLRIVVLCISITTLIFSLVFFFFIDNLFFSLKDISLMNLNLYKASLSTMDLIGILISLKALMVKKSGIQNFDYLNYITNEIKNNEDYYNHMTKTGIKLYHELNNEYGNLNMFINKYISEQNIIKIYRDHINISYLNELYIRNNRKGNDSFPNAIDQFLFNTISFLKKYNYSSNDLDLSKKEEEEYFNYVTFLLIENSYINIIPNLFIKLENIPEIYSKYNNHQKKYIYLIIFTYLAFQTIICIIYILLINLTNFAISEIFKKITKIKFAKIEETIKKIDKFNLHLKIFREELIADEEEEEEKKELEEKEKKKNLKRKTIYKRPSVHFNLTPKKETSSYVSNNGFILDAKNYDNLTLLRSYFAYSVIFTFILCAFIIPILIYSLNMIDVINELMLIINYIYGKLMNTSLNILELKCFIMECQKGGHSLSFEHLGTEEKIQLFVKGIRNFKNIEDFYDNKFMLNACKAAININEDKMAYNICINQRQINNANNTDNIMEILTSFIDYMYKKDIMNSGKVNNYFKQMLFNDSIYQNIEYLYYNYIFTVDTIFESTVHSSLDAYIKQNKFFLLILLFIFCVLMILYNIIYQVLFTPRLNYLINVSKGILKIIPTSVIMNTPELQSYIGNKYNKN